MNNKLLVLIVFLATGCANYRPLPIALPSKSLYEQYKTPPDGSMPYPKDVSQSKQYAWTFAQHYQALKISYQTAIYSYSDGSMFGAIIAMIGGVTKSLPSVLGGGVIAAGSEIPPNRYNFPIQISNFDNAHRAAQCVYEKLDRLNDDEVNSLVAYENEWGREHEKTVGDLTHRTMERIHSSLQEKQSQVALSPLNLEKLQQVIEEVNKTKNPSNTIIQHLDTKYPSQTNMIVSLLSAVKGGDVTYQDLNAKFELCIQQTLGGH